eukprot:8135266-Karenia_brevis.AAC.1
MTLDPRRTGYNEPQPALCLPIADSTENSQLHLTVTANDSISNQGGQPLPEIVETETTVDREATARSTRLTAINL